MCEEERSRVRKSTRQMSVSVPSVQLCGAGCHHPAKSRPVDSIPLQFLTKDSLFCKARTSQLPHFSKPWETIQVTAISPATMMPDMTPNSPSISKEREFLGPQRHSTMKTQIPQTVNMVFTCDLAMFSRMLSFGNGPHEFE